MTSNSRTAGHPTPPQFRLQFWAALAVIILVAGAVRLYALGGAPQRYWLVQALRLYAAHFNPAALAFTGFGDGVSIRRPLYIGEIFWLEVPLWAAAFFGFARQRVTKGLPISVALLVGIWLVIYPVADSLTRGDSSTSVIGGPHKIRSFNLLPLPELLAAYGAVVLWQTLRRNRLGAVAAWGALLAASVLFSLFVDLSLSYYFAPPLFSADSIPYNVGLRPVLERTLADARTCDNIWLQTGNQTYMYYLFLTRYSPQRVQQFDLTHINSSGVLEIAGFDRVSFSEPDVNNPIPPNRPECAGQQQRAYYVTKSEAAWPGWRELSAVYDDQGRLLWRGLVK